MDPQCFIGWVLTYIALRLFQKGVLDDDKTTIGEIISQDNTRLKRVGIAVGNVEDHGRDIV